MQIAKKHIKETAQQLRNLKKEISNLQRNGLYTKIFEATYTYDNKKALLRIFNIAYYFKKHNISIEKIYSSEELLNLINKLGIETNSKGLIQLSHICNLMEGFES